MVFRPGPLSQEETAKQRPASVSRHGIIPIPLTTTDIENRILQAGDDRISHLLTGRTRIVGLLRSIVQHLIDPRHIAILGDQLHVPIGMEEVADRTPVLLLRLIQRGTVEMAQHDVHHAWVSEIPIVRTIRHRDSLIGIGILDVITGGHKTCIVVTIERAVVVGITTEIRGDPPIREEVVALIHVSLEVVIGLEGVLFGQ